MHPEVVVDFKMVKTSLAHPKREGVDSLVFRCKLVKLGLEPPFKA